MLCCREMFAHETRLVRSHHVSPLNLGHVSRLARVCWIIVSSLWFLMRSPPKLCDVQLGEQRHTELCHFALGDPCRQRALGRQQRPRPVAYTVCIRIPCPSPTNLEASRCSRLSSRRVRAHSQDIGYFHKLGKYSVGTGDLETRPRMSRSRSTVQFQLLFGPCGPIAPVSFSRPS